MLRYQIVATKGDNHYTVDYRSMAEIKKDVIKLLDDYEVLNVFESRKLVCRYCNSKRFGKVKITNIENVI